MHTYDIINKLYLVETHFLDFMNSPHRVLISGICLSHTKRKEVKSLSKQMFTKTNTWITFASWRSAGKKRFPNGRTCFTIFRRSFSFMAAKQWTRMVVNCRAAVIVFIGRVSFEGEARIISLSGRRDRCWFVTVILLLVMLDVVPQSFRIIFSLAYLTACILPFKEVPTGLP